MAVLGSVVVRIGDYSVSSATKLIFYLISFVTDFFNSFKF